MWLLVIGGVIGYLLIGAIVAGLCLRFDFIIEEYSDNSLILPVVVLLYPLVLLVYPLIRIGIWIVELVGGRDA